MKPFPFIKQLDSKDCGPTCLRMIAKFYGKNYSADTINKRMGISPEGVSLLNISAAAESIGFRTLGLKISIETLVSEDIFPSIAHWKQNHFVVIYKIKKGKIYVADPDLGFITYTQSEFQQIWAPTTQNGIHFGVVLAIEPTPQFYEILDEKKSSLTFTLLFKYLFKYKQLLFQLALGLLVGSILQLIFPFLTQSIVDVGISSKDIGFIYLILLAQAMLFVGQTSVDFIRSWVLLHINTRLSVSILTDFLVKLMKLPISYFEGKMVGDIIQRMGDQQRIQNFLTGPTLNILFSFFNFFIFAIVIANYNLKIFIVFIISSLIYFLWVMLFLKYRRNIDYKQFSLSSNNQDNIIQIIQGMQEIKMSTSETTKRWQWEKLQAKRFKLNIKSLELSQYQQGGASFINQSKNIIITFLSATAVVHGELTLGAMLAIQYIIGQLNGPIEQFIQLVQIFQDTMISMERLNEIHKLEEEEPEGISKKQKLDRFADITLKQITYTYPGISNQPAINNISIMIPRGKITAIVGVSGSGKTTLLKLLMKFYSPEKGGIFIGDDNLNDISNKIWRKSIGSVLQDSFIFSDTIASNIAVGEKDAIDLKKLNRAVDIANISEFIESLPFGFETLLGASGKGLSQGQKQRLLIARAAYKDPEFIFFDEATNALDANNEKIIMENLNKFFRGKTVVVAAHRLSTVKNADQIIVMEKGCIKEMGTHNELVSLKGSYYTLVKNQLDLGN